MELNRRHYLATGSAVALSLLAGCSDGSTSTEGNDDEPIEASAEDLLPSPDDFDDAGWTAGDIETDPEEPTDGEYATQSYVNDPDILTFDVWVHDTVDAAESEYDSRIEERTSDRSVEEVDVGVEGVAYTFGWAIVEFRDANVAGRVGHVDEGDGQMSVAKDRAAMLHRLWRGE